MSRMNLLRFKNYMRVVALTAIGVAFFTSVGYAQTRQTTNAPQASQTSKTTSINSETKELTPEENEKYKKALELFNKQDLQGAFQALQELAASNSAARSPRVIMAIWFTQLKNLRAARIMLEMATEESPNDPEAFFTLAEFSLRDGELTAAELLTKRGDQALATYTANSQRKRSMEQASLALKIAYSNARGRWNDAQNAILAKIKLEGENAELDSACANALFQMEQYAKAREMFVRAEKISDGQSLPADAAMAQLYAAKGDMESAKKSLDAALKLYPKSTPVLLLSIANALSENNLDSAWKLVQQLYQEDKSAEVLKTYGKVALFRGDNKRAEAAFQEAVRQNPIDSDASNGLALALCEQGDDEKNKRAIQYAAGNVQKQQNNRDYLATLGWVLYRAGQHDEAVKVLQQSTADGQINAASAYYFAVILSDKGQITEAVKFLQAALSTAPPFAKRAQAQALLETLQNTSAQK